MSNDTHTPSHDEGNVSPLASLLASLATMSDEERATLANVLVPSREARAPRVTSRNVATSSTLVLARELSPLVARDEDEARAFVDLANLASEHALHVEIVTSDEGGTRMRMRCACSRSSYFTLATNASTMPREVEEACTRHVRRVRGRAIRIARNDASVSARLALLVASEGASSTPLPLASSVVVTSDEGGEEFARVRGGGASVHLTRDALVTLCERDASSMREVASDDEHATCRTCEARARA